MNMQAMMAQAKKLQAELEKTTKAIDEKTFSFENENVHIINFKLFLIFNSPYTKFLVYFFCILLDIQQPRLSIKLMIQSILYLI